MEIIKQMTQEELFEKLISTKQNIQNTASFIQNDFGRMLDDGITTKEDISNNYYVFLNDIDNIISKLETIKTDTYYLMLDFDIIS